VALQIVLSIDYTERGHLSSVLKEVKETEVIRRNRVPGPLSTQPGIYWGHTEPAAGMEAGRLQMEFLSVVLGTGFVGVVTASHLCVMEVS
jgi:hypothetical protein